MNIEINDNLIINNPEEIVTTPNRRNIMGQSSRNTKIKLLQHSTTIIQLLSLLFVVVIIALCVLEPFEFFTWHPFLLSIGWGLLITQGILSISPYNFLTKHVMRDQRIRLHWLLQLLAIITIIIGFFIVYINKNRLNKYHFQSWHGLFGLITILCFIPTVFGGIVVLYNAKFKKYIKPNLCKLLHISGGIICLICGGISFILSVYTKWFQRRINNEAIIFYCSLFAILSVIILILFHPIRNGYNYLKPYL